jgi:L-lactate dehydrogenase complex protein LldG
MNGSDKNNILKNIRLALTHSTPMPFPESDRITDIYQPLQQDIVVEFAEQFTQLQGKFSFALDMNELAQQLHALVKEHSWTRIYCKDERFISSLPDLLTDDLVNCDASVTGCEALVARTGSMVLSSMNSGRLPSVYAPVHICIAFTSQLLYNINDALSFLRDKYKGALPSLITFATGPSRTADIEKTLVVGVHGPKEVYCFLVDDLPSRV